ncbi:protein tweety homolog 1 [Carcharodon carcharias]|uniref:protein tweety homolog 1 n=1 Tax=Carcharodon carcharias TaxID=13397 RepID=UPI001B7ED50D|nr:protein tweety homolog 1 [Carcharodon carcharias]
MDKALGYVPTRWAHALHGLPHVNLRLEPVDSLFSPHEWEYQQALLFLAGFAILCLALNLLLILIYIVRLCCCSLGEKEESKRQESYCTSWSSMVAVIICCTGIGIGFYGNSEINDGMYQAAYSLANINHTLVTMEALVSNASAILRRAVREELTDLEEVFADRPEFLVITRNSRRQAESVLAQLGGLAFWRGLRLNLLELAEQGSHTEDHRWLAYVLLILLDVLICLLVLLGLLTQGTWMLIGLTALSMLGLIVSWLSLGVESVAVLALGDFCIDPDSSVSNITQTKLGINADLLDYYLTCDDGALNPFHYSVTLSYRAMSTIHSQINSLERGAIAEFPSAQASLLAAQQALNTTERVLHHLTALIHCQGFNKHYVEVLRGICYDAMEGTLYLCAFSFLTVLSHCSMVYTLPRIWRKLHNHRAPKLGEVDEEEPFSPMCRRPRVLPRPALPTFYAYASSFTRQGGTHPTAPPISNAHIAHYM